MWEIFATLGLAFGIWFLLGEKISKCLLIPEVKRTDEEEE